MTQRSKGGEAVPVVDGTIGNEDVEQLNLEQALVDFEMANARVLDLTGRVTTMSAELLRLRAEIGDVRILESQARGEAEAVRNENNEIKRSLAYRGLRILGNGRAALRRR